MATLASARKSTAGGGSLSRPELADHHIRLCVNDVVRFSREELHRSSHDLIPEHLSCAPSGVSRLQLLLEN